MIQLINENILSEDSILFDEETGSNISVSEILTGLNNNDLLEQEQSPLDVKNEIPIEKRNKPFRVYIIPLVLVFLGVLFSLIKSVLSIPSEVSDKSAAYVVGYHMGSALVQAFIILILWTILWALTRKRKINGPLIFSIIYVLISFSILTNYMINEYDAYEEVFTQKVNLMINRALNGNEITSEVFEEATYGKKAELLNITRDLLKNSQKLSLDLQNAVNEVKIDIMLTKATMEDPGEISLARDRLKNFIASIKEIEIAAKDNYNLYQKRITSVDISQKYKDQMMKGFLDSMNESPNIYDYYQIEIEIGNAYDKILQFLQSKEGTYTINEDTIVFDTDEDSAEYSRLVSEIETSAQKENEWHNKQNEKKNNILNSIKDE